MLRKSPTTVLGLLLMVAGIVGLVATFDDSTTAAPPEDRIVIRDGHRIRFEGEFDSAEFERRLQETLDEALGDLEDLDLDELHALEGMRGLEHLHGLEHLDGLGERISRSLENVFENLHHRVDVHSESDFHFDFDRLERHMERLGERLERDLGRIHTHGHLDLGGDSDSSERSLRRQIRRLERKLEDLRNELSRLEEDGEI